MAKNRKYSKALIVVFLTILIWVWADLSQDEELPLSNLVAVRVAPSTDPTLWVSFVRPDSSVRSTVTIDSVTLKGPASQVAEVDRMRKKGQLELDLALIPEDENLTEPTDARSFNVLDFLKQSTEIRDLGLTVESCEPPVVTVQIRRLVAKTVPVQCVDENGMVLVNARIDPAEVQAHVQNEESPIATVRLSARERDQAGAAVVKKTPYVELASGQRRHVAAEVEVTLSSEEGGLAESSFDAKWAYCFSPVLQGKYRVELDPQSRTDLGSVRVKATPEALRAYKDETLFHIFVYVLDADKETMNVTNRKVVFNFPEEFVRKGEIEAAVDPVVNFKLVPITADNGQNPPP